jgi:hypothetical protein
MIRLLLLALVCVSCGRVAFEPSLADSSGSGSGSGDGGPLDDVRNKAAELAKRA